MARKTRNLYANEPIRKETVQEYLARGGKITKGQSSLPVDLTRVSESNIIDMALGASYDDLAHGGTRFYVPGSAFEALREETADLSFDAEYHE